MGRHARAKQAQKDYERGYRAAKAGKYREVPGFGSESFRHGVAAALNEVSNGDDRGTAGNSSTTTSSATQTNS